MGIIRTNPDWTSPIELSYTYENDAIEVHYHLIFWFSLDWKVHVREILIFFAEKTAGLVRCWEGHQKSLAKQCTVVGGSKGDSTFFFFNQSQGKGFWVLYHMLLDSEAAFGVLFTAVDISTWVSL